MKLTRLGMVSMFALTCLAASARAQEVEVTVFDSARLEQLVAPIALYPDSLLMQVLMAATYPLEVIQAERFARENSHLEMEELQNALAGHDWEPSVKALVGFPDVLKMMSENLDWTRDLGEAFLVQREDLFDAVQQMRRRAYEAGTLQTTAEQVVTVRDDRIIVIEPANTEVIYVPQYSPVYVYGGWSYPYWYYPRVYRYWPSSGFHFSIGGGNWIGWGSWLWGRPYWSWGGSGIFVNVDLYRRFLRRHHHHYWDRDHDDYRGDWARWRHDPRHRRGVRYRDDRLAARFWDRRRWMTRDEARGFDGFGRPPRFDRDLFDRDRFDRDRDRGDRDRRGRDRDRDRGDRDRDRGDRANGANGGREDGRPDRDRPPVRRRPDRPERRQPEVRRPMPDRRQPEVRRPTPRPERSQPEARPRPTPGREVIRRPTQRPTPRREISQPARSQGRPQSVFGGARHPGLDRAASNRGMRSRKDVGFGRPGLPRGAGRRDK